MNIVDVLGYEGLYSVSSDGHVYSHINKRFLYPKGKSYLQVRLCKDGIQSAIKIHRIVAMAFIPNPNNHFEVNHINGIKSDNRVENLEWCSRSENIRHSFRVLGRISAKGVNHPFSKKVYDSTTETVYNCVRESAIARGLNRNTVKKYARDGKNGFSYC